MERPKSGWAERHSHAIPVIRNFAGSRDSIFSTIDQTQTIPLASPHRPPAVPIHILRQARAALTKREQHPQQVRVIDAAIAIHISFGRREWIAGDHKGAILSTIANQPSIGRERNTLNPECFLVVGLQHHSI